MKLYHFSCTAAHHTRRAKFCSLVSPFFRYFSSFRLASRHCLVLFYLFSLAQTRINSRHAHCLVLSSRLLFSLGASSVLTVTLYYPSTATANWLPFLLRCVKNRHQSSMGEKMATGTFTHNFKCTKTLTTFNKTYRNNKKSLNLGYFLVQGQML